MNSRKQWLGLFLALGMSSALWGADLEAAKPALTKLGLDKFYQVGNQWEVAFVPYQVSLQKRSQVELWGGDALEPVLFRYRVTALGRDARGNRTATIDIIQANTGNYRAGLFGTYRMDATCGRLGVTLNRFFNPVSKDYSLTRQSRPEKKVDLDGRGVLSTGFDGFPCDIPNLDRQFGAVVTLSSFPPELNDVATYFSVPKGKVLSLKMRDSLNREVLVYWRAGDPWPLLVKSRRGVALLVHQKR